MLILACCRVLPAKRCAGLGLGLGESVADSSPAGRGELQCEDAWSYSKDFN
jgi:hypothetical protein